MMKFFEDFHTHGVISRNMNETYICLIPKGSQAGRIEDFRPISLITSMYKLLAKVLAHRLRAVLKYTIAKEQNAFIPDRQMIDYVVIASEVVKFARRRGLQGFILKLDFAKAYARLCAPNEGFLAEMDEWVHFLSPLLGVDQWLSGRQLYRTKRLETGRSAFSVSLYLGRRHDGENLRHCESHGTDRRLYGRKRGSSCGQNDAISAVFLLDLGPKVKHV
ncbi:hypothetical protein Scep_028267 [Stephania cephalantha]|uniref:Reverse transcriptase domain-containing protein n=1 Tax=Stephania cephalantha TaxID=152367 RepID=A0AAP0E9J6_9MAGN